jgi:hypothetical protein
MRFIEKRNAAPAGNVVSVAKILLRTTFIVVAAIIRLKFMKRIRSFEAKGGIQITHLHNTQPRYLCENQLGSPKKIYVV